MNYTKVKVTGLCDAGCGKEARIWYGRTNKAYCGDMKCYGVIESAYIEHCKKVDEQIRFEKEMEDY